MLGDERLIILTASFPYGMGEEFLAESLPYAPRYFREVVLQPLVGSRTCRPVPEGCRVNPPLLYAMRQCLPHLICPSPTVLRQHVADFVRHASPGRLRDWVTLAKSMTMCSLLMRSRQFRELVASSRADHVLWHFYWGSGFVNVLPFLPPEPMAVARLHRWDLYESDQWHPFRNKIIERLGMLFPVSEGGRRHLVERHPAYRHKIRRAGIGCEPMPCAPTAASDTLRLLSVSSVIPLKRVEVILDAVLRCGHSVQWTHVGTGPGLDRLRRLARVRARTGVEIRLTGYLSRKALRELYAKQPFDLFVNLSTIEGVPVSIMEALSAGIPVLATDAGSTSELVDSTCGFLVPSRATDLVDIVSAQLTRIVHMDLHPYRHAARLRYLSRCQASVQYNTFYRTLRAVLIQGPCGVCEPGSDDVLT